MSEKHSNQKSDDLREASYVPGIDDAVASELGKRLREAFSETLDAPVPDRFKDLIRSLKDREQGDV